MTRIDLGGGASIVLHPHSPCARLMEIAPSEALRRVAELVDRRRNHAGLIDDWLAHAVDFRDPGARTLDEDLFVDFYAFCQLMAGSSAASCSFSSFVRGLDQRGIDRSRSKGRSARVGCRLVPRRTASAREAIIRAASCSSVAERFVRECCAIDHQGRVRSSKLFSVHQAWARSNDLQPLTVKTFAAALTGLGVERRRSNGVWWMGLELRPTPLTAEPLPSSMSDSPAVLGLFGGAGWPS